MRPISTHTAHPPAPRARRAIPRRVRVAALPLAAAILLLAYTATLQTQINGSSDEYMVDVGEVQVALNVWGTIHHTGYPLYAILGNVFTAPLRALGAEPAAAASLFSTAWGGVALGGFGLLIWRLTGRPSLAAAGVLLLGLARSIWIHHVIAEVYSMSLALTVLMLLVALWPAPWAGAWRARRRVLWLALLGGIGVAHHRAVALVAPGLFLALWPHRRALLQGWPRTLAAAAALFLLGFLPYLYLPVRAWQDAEWVYGEPGTWAGFWIEFTGREADRLVTTPAEASGYLENAAHAVRLLAQELTVPGLVAALAALVVALRWSPRRDAARVVALAALAPLLFSVAYRTAVLPGAILMPVVLALVFAVSLAGAWLVDRRPRVVWGLWAVFGLWALALALTHYDWIRARTTDPTGLATIERVGRIPRDAPAAFTLPWGPRYTAAAYSVLVTGENSDVRVVDHKGDYRALIADGYVLYTEPEAFYTFPPVWWRERLGGLALTSAAPGIVQLRPAPERVAPDDPPVEPVAYGIARRDAWLTCDAHAIYLHVLWEAAPRPTADLSIFVHLTGAARAPVLVTADRSAPVYGFYPFTAWSAREQVRDDFTLPRLPGGTVVRTGLYKQDVGGSFINYGELALPVADCQPVAGTS